MFRVKTQIGHNVQKELTKTALSLNFISLILGTVGIVSFIVLSTIYENAKLDFLLIFAIPFAIGLIFYISIKNNNKKSKLNDIENEYEFNEDYFNITTIKNNENIGTVKIYYKDLIKFKQTKSYYFVYINIYSAFAIDKKYLSEEQALFLSEKIKLWKV